MKRVKLINKYGFSKIIRIPKEWDIPRITVFVSFDVTLSFILDKEYKGKLPVFWEEGSITKPPKKKKS